MLLVADSRCFSLVVGLVGGWIYGVLGTEARLAGALQLGCVAISDLAIKRSGIP